MTLVIELPPELEKQLEREAVRKGQAPAELAREAVERMLAASERHLERNRKAIELLEEWRNAAPDPEEEAGYPLEITPLSLREVSVD